MSELFGAAAGAALVAALALGGLGFWLCGKSTRLSAASLAVALAFLAGYLCLPRDFAGFVPSATQPWQFLPYGGLLVAAVSGLAWPGRFALALRWLGIVAGGLFGMLLAPAWPVWNIDGPMLRGIAGFYITVVGISLWPLASRVSSRWLVGTLAGSGLLLAALAGVLVSMRYGQLAAAAGCSLFGAWIMLLASRSDRAAINILPVYALLVGGVAWIACVEPEPPLSWILVAPFVPHALWLVAAGRPWSGRPLDMQAGKP